MSSQKTIVGLVAKPGNPRSKELVEQLRSWLKAKEISYRICSDTARELQLENTEPQQLIARQQLAASCSPIVVLGGDGTLISVCRHPSEKSPVIIGVNLGTLGFLTEITVEELFPVLESVLAGEVALERRSLLRAELLRNGSSEREEFTAINDVVVTKEAPARIFAIEVSVSGQFACLVRGDGVIVATPGGSTAYSLAAGGSIVHPQVNALLLTPICPHSLTTRPLVLPGSSELTLKVSEQTEGSSVFLTLDGQQGMALEENDRVTVTSSQHCVLFAKSPSKSYYDVLGRKLKWATL